MPWRNDPGYLFPLTSQTSDRDRYWLAELTNYCRDLQPSYKYVEIGSYLGGTLTASLIDERCSRVVSIDLRPKVQPDARGAQFDYSQVNTGSMLEALRKLANIDLTKLKTFDGRASEYQFGDEKFNLALIDGEHTDEAVVADFLSVVDHLSENAICAFHDSQLITTGLEIIMLVLIYLRRPHRFIMFQNSFVSALFIGPHASSLPERLVSGAWDWSDFREKSRKRLLLDIVHNRINFSYTLKPRPIVSFK